MIGLPNCFSDLHTTVQNTTTIQDRFVWTCHDGKWIHQTSTFVDGSVRPCWHTKKTSLNSEETHLDTTSCSNTCFSKTHQYRASNSKISSRHFVLVSPNFSFLLVANIILGAREITSHNNYYFHTLAHVVNTSSRAGAVRSSSSTPATLNHMKATHLGNVNTYKFPSTKTVINLKMRGHAGEHAHMA